MVWWTPNSTSDTWLQTRHIRLQHTKIWRHLVVICPAKKGNKMQMLKNVAVFSRFQENSKIRPLVNPIQRNYQWEIILHKLRKISAKDSDNCGSIFKDPELRKEALQSRFSWQDCISSPWSSYISLLHVPMEMCFHMEWLGIQVKLLKHEVALKHQILAPLNTLQKRLSTNKNREIYLSILCCHCFNQYVSNHLLIYSFSKIHPILYHQNPPLNLSLPPIWALDFKIYSSDTTLPYRVSLKL